MKFKFYGAKLLSFLASLLILGCSEADVYQIPDEYKNISDFVYHIPNGTITVIKFRLC